MIDINIRAEVQCRRCQTIEEVELTETYTSADHSWDDRNVERQLERMGWKEDLCPFCLREEEEEEEETI